MTSVDNRVVQMKFNNSQFESGAQKSIKTLEKLKQALKLDKGTKGMEDVEKKASSMKFDKLVNGVENISQKFSAMSVVAVTALANITNSAIEAGKKIVSALTIDPIKMGFQEYETQINAVQTILANTSSKGTTLREVNAALDELNKYADMTIYNFTEMTRNIGTFTAAGVDLNTSVSAIKGIANLAAVSGSTSQQASTAMYQLSQALAAGTVKLQDWNSVVNAGMGGQVFQDALKETARVHGIAIDEIIDKEGSFRESLSKGWLSSEILTETLAKFTGDLTEAQLKSMGYTDEQAKKILKMGETANDAATKVKTFTQLFDTLQEAAQSGWTQSWEIIVGDFEEAKEFLTYLSDTISNVLNEQADARNQVLQGWKDLGGRAMMIEAVKNVFEATASILKPISEAMSSVFHRFNEFDLLNITRQFRDFTKALILSEESAAKVKAMFQGFFSVISLGGLVIKSLAKGFMTIVQAILPAGGSILNLGESIGNFLTKLVHDIKVTQAIPETINAVATRIAEIITNIRTMASDMFSGVKSFGEEYGEGILSIFQGIADGVKSIIDGVFGLFDKTAGGASMSVGMLGGAVMEFVNKGMPLFVAFGTVASNVFQTVGNAIGDVVSNLSFERVSQVLNEALLAGILVTINNFIKGLSDAIPDINGLMDSFGDILGGVRESLEAYQQNLKADTLYKIAKAVGILVLSLVALSGIDPEKLAVALAALSVAFGELVGSMMVLQGAMQALDVKSAGGVTAMMISLAVSIGILSASIAILGRMDLKDLAKGLMAVGVGLAELIGAMKLMSMAKIDKKSIVNLQSLAVSLVILAAAVKIFSTMSMTELAKGLGAVAIALGEMVAFTALMTKTGGSLNKASRGIMTIAMSMVVLGAAVKIFSTMSMNELAKGLGAVAVSLGVMVAALNLMKGTDAAGAAGIMALALAMNMLIPPMLVFGNMPLTQIAKGLGVMAASIAIFGGAAKLLQPVIPSMLAMAGAIALLGVGCLAAGAGVLALSAGLAALSVSGVAGAGALVAILGMLIGLIPMVAQQLGIGFVTIVQTIASMATELMIAIGTIITAILTAVQNAIPQIIETLTLLITEILTMIQTVAPQLGETLLVLIRTALTVLNEAIPDLIETGMNLIMALLQGIADHIGEIVDIVTQLITNFLSALSANLPTIIQAGFDFILNFINSLADSVRTNMPAVIDAIINLGMAIIQGLVDTVMGLIGNVEGSFGDMIQAGLDKVSEIGQGLFDIGKNIINGLIDGIKSMAQNVIDAAKGVVDGAIQGAKNLLGIHSPSKVFMAFGEYCDEGLIIGLNALKNKVGYASESVSSEAVLGMSNAMNKVADLAERDFKYEPEITPVLNLDELSRESKNIEGILNQNNAAIGVQSLVMAQRASQLSSMKSSSDIEELRKDIADLKDSSGITFNQYNNSPKALSNAEIYRNTRSQLALAKNKFGR